MRWLLAVLILLGSTFLAGCSTNGTLPADLRMSAAWQPWGDDPLPHLMITFQNLGDRPAYVGPGAQELSVTGPMGTVPIDWGDTPFARPIEGGSSVVVAFHPRATSEGRFTLSIDHAQPNVLAPPLGTYVVCLDQHCEKALLK